MAVDQGPQHRLADRRESAPFLRRHPHPPIGFLLDAGRHGRKDMPQPDARGESKFRSRGAGVSDIVQFKSCKDETEDVESIMPLPRGILIHNYPRAAT